VKIRKAVITAAGQHQRALPLQTLIDRDGQEKSVLAILIEQTLVADIDEVCVVVWPGDELRYAQATGKHNGRVRFVPQPQPLGYGHAIWCARDFTAGEAFLHLVGDHLYIGSDPQAATRRLVERASAEACTVSAVQPTRENLLPHYGSVGGRRVPGQPGVYRVDTVIEKPTPTEAEQRLTVPGLRAGFYLCFYGMHVLTPAVMDILGRGRVSLSEALAELCRREQYLAIEEHDRRYDIGARYGVFVAQLALAMNGRDRGEVLAQCLELLASRSAP
jgi:UTP--glucose-1-phosphate uridylyltransferase